MKKILLYILLTICVLPFYGQSTLTILHTNDTHSRIEPFDDHGTMIGGSLRRLEYIRQVRAEQPNVLLFDAGDYWQGTPYFNLFGGRVEIEMMNRMGYDAATLGNHEFDNGLNALAERLAEAKFPIVCCNYEFHHPGLDTLVKPYLIFEKAGQKIGLFGLVTNLEGLLSDPTILDTIHYRDAVECARQAVDYLRNTEHCNLVICLSHLGYSPEKHSDPMCDKIVAEKVNGIDLIIGGHSHTMLKEPIVINNTQIVQVGYKGGRIGRIDVEMRDESGEF
ncbi:MAG: metallophosphatase [Bacteroidales bacterium]|nr:metallophosphatase [Bacteroidales bacterium]